MLTVRGLGVVLGDLAEMGYDARWGVLGACDVGAKHKRDRIWIMAYSNGLNVQGDRLEAGKIRQTPTQLEGLLPLGGQHRERDWVEPKPGLVGVVHAMADRVDRTKAIGNGQVPQCAALAWRILSGQH